MAEAELLEFEFKDVTTALVKQAKLHSGIWGVYLEFGIAAGNVADQTGTALPTALVPVIKIGPRKTEAVDNLSVDAAEVDPASAASKATKRPTSKRAPAKGATD